MATRSTIAIELPNGKIKAVYCHWDGYLSYNGKILQKHYTTADKVLKLVSKGAISSLGEVIGRKHPFDQFSINKDDPDYAKKLAAIDKAQKSNYTKFYARDRGEKLQVNTYKDFDDYADNLDGQEYDYLFTKYGDWRVRSWRTDSWELLNEQIALDDKEREEATA